MAYDPTKDFVGLWRNTAGNLSKTEMPGLDFVASALARAGLITLAVSATAPLVSQSTTAWLRPAVPSTSAEGALFLWDPAASAYAAATPKLLLYMLEAAANQNGVSWYASVGGPPANVIGNNGDFAIRTDQPGGIYGPKAAGAWPVIPLPGTTSGFVSEQLDEAFGPAEGNMLFRGASLWQSLAIGAVNTVMCSTGSEPFWRTLTSLLDTFGNTRGSILYRGAAGWAALGPGAAGLALKSNGPGADPSYAVPEFPAGTVMLFGQTTAPTGWTKLVDVNDVGLRVTSGAVGSGGVTSFSTVFGQTATGVHALTVAEMPAHSHDLHSSATGDGPSKIFIEGTGASGSGVGGGGGFGPPNTLSINSTGSGGTHSHSVSLQLAYIDVIRAVKN